MNLLDPELVEANRRGQVLPRQAAWLKSASWGGMGGRTRVLLGVAIGLGALAFVFFALSTSLNTSFILIAGLLIAILFAVVLGPRLLKALRDSSSLQEATAGGLIRQASGELVYENGSYMVRAGDQTLPLPASTNACGLLPGLRYLCYYPEGSNLILSAEQLGSGSSGMVRQALTGVLASANRFQMDDLEANRNGGLSAAQRKALIRQTLGSGGSVLLGLILIGTVVLPSLLQGRLPQDVTVLLIPVLMALGLLVPGALAIYRGLSDAFSGVVETVQGSAVKASERRSSGRSSRTVYLYNINDLKLQVPQSAYLALIDGLEYRAFYTPRTRKLLSMEAVNVPESALLGV